VYEYECEATVRNMRDKAIRVFVRSSFGLVCGLSVACAGGVTPAHDQDFDDEVAAAYGNGAPVGAGGSANTGAGGSGSAAPGGGVGGSASTSPSGSAGSGNTAPAGAGGTGGSVATGGAGSSSLPAAGGASAAGGCDGFAILALRCNGGSCHGSPTAGTLSNFAFSEDSAKSFIDKQSSMCSATDNAALLDPEKPASSLIIKKANGSSSCGSPMPLGGTPLSAADLSCLQEWIGGL
jgi:hypothetical protein